MDYLLTFLEGIVTFLSPCLLPLLPVYIAYFAGGDGGEAHSNVRRTLLCALCFVAGFGLLFVLMGAFAGALGAFLAQNRRVLDLACGATLAVLGLNYLGIVRIEPLNATRRLNTDANRRGPTSSFVFGVVLAVGWTPCVGTFLASALSLAASSASVAAGVGLLACFSVGLGLPFVLSAVVIDQLEGAFAWVKRHYGLINRACGSLLVVEGVLMATGLLGTFLGSLV